VALTTDAAGETVLVVGGQSTTIAGAEVTSSTASAVGMVGTTTQGGITLVPSQEGTGAVSAVVSATSTKRSAAGAMGRGRGRRGVGGRVALGVVVWGVLGLGG